MKEILLACTLFAFFNLFGCASQGTTPAKKMTAPSNDGVVVNPQKNDDPFKSPNIVRAPSYIFRG